MAALSIFPIVYRPLRVACVVVLAVLIGCGGASEEAREPVVVFAAASLTDAVEALADSFETVYPQYRVVPSVAATSILARQIQQGAPAGIFFSANVAWMERVVEDGHVAGAVAYPLANRLVVVAPMDTDPLPSLETLAAQPRVALADPEHVPAGIYAKEGLQCAGLWERVQPRVVPMLDVRAALLSVRNGAADVAVVYASDVEADPSVRVVLNWPSDCQPDIRYAVARLADAPDPKGAALLLAYITDPARAALWERFGFLPRLSDNPAPAP